MLKDRGVIPTKIYRRMPKILLLLLLLFSWICFNLCQLLARLRSQRLSLAGQLQYRKLDRKVASRMTLLHGNYDGTHSISQACFKRRATAVLSWLDCNSTAARPQYDLVSDVEFNSVEQNGCCRKQNTIIKKRFRKL